MLFIYFLGSVYLRMPKFRPLEIVYAINESTTFPDKDYIYPYV